MKQDNIASDFIPEQMKRFLVIPFLFLSILGIGQHIDQPIPYFTFGKGLGIIPPDSMYSLNIRFRIQNRMAATSDEDDDLNIKEYEAIVRRLRLRFDGFIYSPKLTYVLQLSFSRGDMDWDNTSFPNVIRDAMVIYRINSNWALGMGQGKLPGNRQRIVSSGDMQFADRSQLNALFNVDRDFGMNFYYNNHINHVYYSFRGAISSGDGRNISKTDEGLGYSCRAEIYPLGQFKNGGDYFEGDLEREKTPKLSIAGFYFYDDRAVRTGGTLGKPLHQPRTFQNVGGDILFKYQGIAFSTEYMRRESNNPITKSGTDIRYVYAGEGVNSELSYLFKNNFQIAGRYTKIIPFNSIRAYEKETNYYTMAVSKYIRGHRLKLQSDLTFKEVSSAPANNNWQLRFQIELGI